MNRASEVSTTCVSGWWRENAIDATGHSGDNVEHTLDATPPLTHAVLTRHRST